jgi:peptide-methionine (S)-S-oxide reductase
LRSSGKTRDRIASRIKGEIKTQILPFTGFYLAEDYHQKHALRRYPELAEEFLAMYPTTEELVYSMAAARVNGYLAGYGGCDNLKGEVHDFGLSTEGSETLLEIVCGRKATISCKIG